MTTPAIRLYNTFTRSKEELKPLGEGIVRIYSCGPTVYRYVHVGNLRTFMLPDLLRRSIEYLGYQTEQVMNITDVGHLTDDTFDRGEDKMLVSARLENRSPEEIAAHYTNAFIEDAAKVNIRRADHYPHATQYIPQMIELIERLIVRGHAYEVGGTVYYDIASFAAYGSLSRNTTDKLLAGARGEVDPRKRHPGDFTLWKAAGEHRLQVWPSPWGVLSHVDVAAWGPVRHPYRRIRQRLPASRGGDRAERRGYRASSGVVLDARRPADARRGAHGEVRRKLLSRVGA
jgi:cysteinyl-tRNA synthetase